MYTTSLFAACLVAGLSIAAPTSHTDKRQQDLGDVVSSLGETLNGALGGDVAKRQQDLGDVVSSLGETLNGALGGDVAKRQQDLGDV
ncbi:hypothetical protein LTR17_018899, partial [Elasticomyces elasticus]